MQLHFQHGLSRIRSCRLCYLLHCVVQKAMAAVGLFEDSNAQNTGFIELISR